jgi:hypothetical protein
MAQLSLAMVKDAFQRYGELSLPIRLLSGAVISLLAGTGLGFFAEYAGYRWALYYGIRPPLEGIPFLRVTVTALTVTLLVGGAALFMLVQAASSWILRTLENYISQAVTIERVINAILPSLEHRNVVTAAVEVFRSIRLLPALISALGLGASVAITFHVAESSGIPTEIRPALAVLLGIIFVVLFLLAWNPDSKIGISLGAVASFVFAGPFLLFNVDVYGELLRTLGYGGGLEVRIALAEEEAGIGQKAVIQGSLLLRTNQVVLVYQQAENRVREIPLHQIIYVEHSATAMQSRKLPLPPVR